MPSKSQSSKQARQQLKKLRELGLYSGDLRKRVTNYALGKLKLFRDVLTGKASVVKPKNPGRFKDIFTVQGDKVIVPRRKGEKISIDKKTGEIVSVRKVGDRTVTARGRQIVRGQKIPKPEPDANGNERRVQYVIPFNASGGGVNWMRFPTWDELQKFMAGYDYKGWQDYVVEEHIDNEIDDDELEARLMRKRKGRAIKGAPKQAREMKVALKKKAVKKAVKKTKKKTVSKKRK